MQEKLRVEEITKVSEGRENDPEKRIEAMPHSDAIVVCGGELKKNKKGEVVAGIESKMRALGALELWRRDLTDKIILTGGIAAEYPEDKSIAEAMKDYLIKKGVPEEVIHLETTSKNTAENLKNIMDILDKKNIRKAVLETSEFHLGRAKQLFGNILEERGLKLEEITSLSAEELLNERSPHYRNITKYYQFPHSVINLPTIAIKKGLREFLRRILIYVDRQDKVATFLAHKFRTKEPL